MESLRGIFPQSLPPQKRDFLKENVMKIKQIQRMSRKSKDKSEYSNKFAKQPGNLMVSRTRLCENTNPAHRSSTNLALSSSKAPITNLRKSLSTLSIHSRECGTQTVDPEADEFFLKDTIIRYPSASTIRSATGSQLPTCSRGHAMEPPEERSSRYKSHFNDRRDEYSEKVERHISNLSEFLDKGSVSKRQGSKKPTSILKSSSSLQKLNKNSINESQQREDKSCRVGSAHRNLKLDTIELSDDENGFEEETLENNKELELSQRKERGGGDSEVEAKKLQQQKAAAIDDPDCPDGHVPLSDDERLEALKLAKKRFKDFVDELNRLPMTSETLRVRNRKIEIEKELRSLEINIRVFSRPKVYVKLTN